MEAIGKSRFLPHNYLKQQHNLEAGILYLFVQNYSCRNRLFNDVSLGILKRCAQLTLQSTLLILQVNRVTESLYHRLSYQLHFGAALLERMMGPRRSSPPVTCLRPIYVLTCPGALVGCPRRASCTCSPQLSVMAALPCFAACACCWPRSSFQTQDSWLVCEYRSVTGNC